LQHERVFGILMSLINPMHTLWKLNTLKNTLKCFSFPLSILLTIGMLVIYSLSTLSCKDETTNNHTSDIIFPDSLISFNIYVQRLFQQTCLGGGCHSGSQPAANLNLEYNTWSALIDYQPDIVLETKGHDSPLVMYLDGRLLPQMPLQSKPLTQNQINGVKKWIDEGALNN
jgi:hypothetical protein